jgi:cell pole-organizing protein PopZ
MGSAHTLEDVVRELLRPMMTSWLDERLPVIIERLVRAELARALDQAVRV